MSFADRLWRDGEGSYDVSDDGLLWRGGEGSSRLGSADLQRVLSENNSGGPIAVSCPRRYELTNHLGNIPITFGEDIVQYNDEEGNLLLEAPTILSHQDYTAFGLEWHRNPTLAGDERYRFGFNGKEQDAENEWSDFTHYDYGFRIYNPAVARFLSVDPLSPEYPELTPYQFASNTPIAAIDMDGLEARPAYIARSPSRPVAGVGTARSNLRRAPRNNSNYSAELIRAEIAKQRSSNQKSRIYGFGETSMRAPGFNSFLPHPYRLSLSDSDLSSERYVFTPPENSVKKHNNQVSKELEDAFNRQASFQLLSTRDQLLLDNYYASGGGMI